MTRPPAHGVAGWLSTALLLAYPIAIYFLIDDIAAGWLGTALVAMLLLRWGSLLKRHSLLLTVFGILVIGYIVLLVQTNSPYVLKVYPTIISLSLLIACIYTLFVPPSLAERLARALGMPVSEAGIPYTRGVTIVWSVFFALNGIVSGLVTFFGSTAAWTFYNGFLSYVLIALIFVVEYAYRGKYKQRVRHRYGKR